MEPIDQLENDADHTESLPTLNGFVPASPKYDAK